MAPSASTPRAGRSARIDPYPGEHKLPRLPRARARPRAPPCVSKRYWPAITILDEQTGHGHESRYLIQWAGEDPVTGRAWEPSWEPRSHLTPPLIAYWESKQAPNLSEKEEAAPQAEGQAEEQETPALNTGVHTEEELFPETGASITEICSQDSQLLPSPISERPVPSVERPSTPPTRRPSIPSLPPRAALLPSPISEQPVLSVGRPSTPPARGSPQLSLPPRAASLPPHKLL